MTLFIQVNKKHQESTVFVCPSQHKQLLFLLSWTLDTGHFYKRKFDLICRNLNFSYISKLFLEKAQPQGTSSKECLNVLTLRGIKWQYVVLHIGQSIIGVTGVSDLDSTMAVIDLQAGISNSTLHCTALLYSAFSHELLCEQKVAFLKFAMLNFCCLY